MIWIGFVSRDTQTEETSICIVASGVIGRTGEFGLTFISIDTFLLIQGRFVPYVALTMKRALVVHTELMGAVAQRCILAAFIGIDAESEMIWIGFVPRNACTYETSWCILTGGVVFCTGILVLAFVDIQAETGRVRLIP
jgi:hypothetical protein